MRVLDANMVLAAGGVTGVLLERSRSAADRRVPTLTATRALTLIVCGAALPAAARLADLGSDAERVALLVRTAALVVGIALVWRGAGRGEATEHGR